MVKKRKNILNFSQKTFADLKNRLIFALALKQGLVVQLVRIHACHAWGRGFESRPDRKIREAFREIGMLFCPLNEM